MKSTEAVHTTIQNRVLQLDGAGSYVQLPPHLFSNLDEATVEAWVKWHSFGYYSQPFGFGGVGAAWQVMAINHELSSPNLQFFIYLQTGTLYLIKVPGILLMDDWHHIAAVTGKAGMKLYFNGALVGEHAFTGSFSAIPCEQNYFGKSHWAENTNFHGQLDEVRLWRVARTGEQIREAMHQKLTGREPNLVGLWNFDAGDARDASPNGYHGQLCGNARCVLAQLPTPQEVVTPSIVYGTITDAPGNPLPNATVQLEPVRPNQPRSSIGVEADPLGQYQMAILPIPAGVGATTVKNLSPSPTKMDWHTTGSTPSTRTTKIRSGSALKGDWCSTRRSECRPRFP